MPVVIDDIIEAEVRRTLAEPRELEDKELTHMGPCTEDYDAHSRPRTGSDKEIRP